MTKPRDAEFGDNSKAAGAETVAPQSLSPTSQQKLKQFVARIERLEEEKKSLANDLKEVYLEAKTLGFNTKALRGAIKFRKQDRQEREEEQAILDLYLVNLGDIDAPLLNRN